MSGFSIFFDITANFLVSHFLSSVLFEPKESGQCTTWSKIDIRRFTAPNKTMSRTMNSETIHVVEQVGAYSRFLQDSSPTLNLRKERKTKNWTENNANPKEATNESKTNRSFALL